MKTNNLNAKVMTKVILYVTIIVITFSLSLLFIPYEFFPVTAFIVLLFLNAVEKELNKHNTKFKYLERMQKLQQQSLSNFDNSRISKQLR